MPSHLLIYLIFSSSGSSFLKCYGTDVNLAFREKMMLTFNFLEIGSSYKIGTVKHNLKVENIY